MSEVWTIRTTLDWCKGYLERHGDENPRLSAEWLLCAAMDLSRIELYMDFDRPLSDEERDVLRDSLRRRGAGEPLQYISGEAAFRHIVLKTARGVLIPRPETEQLVQVVLDALPAHGVLEKRYLEEAAVEVPAEEAGEDADEAVPAEPAFEFVYKGPRVLEVGCGTGCIGLSLAKEATVHVTMTDISPDALSCARRNAEALGMDALVDVREADCADGIDGPFDVLVSNPPYIPTAELAELPTEVTGFEPRLALDGGADGLEFFDRLVAEVPRLLVDGGLIAFELHETCLDEAETRLKAAGFHDIKQVQDLAGRPRIISAIWG